MRNVSIVAAAALAAISLGCVSQKVSAGELSFRSHAHKCGRYDHCGFPVACPSGACYSIYGTYGPYGGAPYWGRYTYSGWRYR